jgi:hypothetical protein
MEVLVSDVIASAQAELAQSPEGILSLKHRARIWAQLATLSDARIGHVRRVQLNEACVRRVLDRWHARFPGDNGVERLLKFARQVVDGQVDEVRALEQRDRFYVDVVETRRYADDASAMFVGLAAANTVIEALIANNDDAIPNVDDDEEMDPETYDVSYLCASAAARGLNARPADAEARRDFWTWYLNQAIPEAYSLADARPD